VAVSLGVGEWSGEGATTEGVVVEDHDQQCLGLLIYYPESSEPIETRSFQAHLFN